jgi:hypothetical protein
VTALALQLASLGYDSLRDAVEEYIATGGEGWRSEHEFLAALARDVRTGFDNAGDEDDRASMTAALLAVDNLRRR